MSLYRDPFHLKRSRVNPPAVELATSRWYEMVILAYSVTFKAAAKASCTMYTEARAQGAPIEARCRSPGHNTQRRLDTFMIGWCAKLAICDGFYHTILMESSFSYNTSYCQRVTRQHSLCFNFFFSFSFFRISLGGTL